MKKLLTITLALISILLITGCGAKKVKVQDYIEIEYTPAYDGYATPELVIDEEGLNSNINTKKVEKLLRKALKESGEYEDFGEEFEELVKDYSDSFANFSEFFDIDFADNYEKLSNGDKITVEVSADEDVAFMLGMSSDELMKELGIKLSKNEIEIKVKDLEELKAIELDLGKMIKLDFGKYNGYGVPTAEIDTEYLKKATIPEFVEEYANEYSGHIKYVIEDYYEWFDVEFDKPYSNLSNGDTVTVKVVLNDELAEDGITLSDLEVALGITVGKGTKTFVVSNLQEPKNVIDVFEDIEEFIVYKGGNGNGYIYSLSVPTDYSKQIGDIYLSKGTYRNSIKAIYNNKSIGEISLHHGAFDDDEDLSKGDTIVITSDFDAEAFENIGYVIPSDQTTVVVPDLGEYLTSREQITSEVIGALKNEITETREPEEICEIYLATYNPGVECDHISTAFIVPIIYKSGWFGGYFADDVYDVIIKPDGTVETTYEYNSWGSYDSLEEVKAALDTENYSFELIDSGVKEGE